MGNIGAKDYIDRLLVKKYATEKVDNHELTTSMVSPEKMMAAMSDFSTVSRNMFALQNRLTEVCSSINAASANYKRRAYIM